jgi:hypothetical protein
MLDGQRGRIGAGVLHPHRQLGRPRAAAGHRAQPRGQQLEVGVPDPRDVVAVGGAIVEQADDVELAALEGQGAQDLVGAGRVLDQQEDQVAVAGADDLRTPERRRHVLEARHDVAERHVEGDPQCSGAERVVDVVEAGEGEGDLGLAGGGVQPEARRAHPFEADVRGHHARVGPPLAAVGAVVVPEVGEVRGVVGVGVPAAAAMLGVGGVLELGQGEAVVVDAEVERLLVPAQVRHQRVVGVEDEMLLSLDHLGPAIGDRVELAVAVELVAEQVAEQERAGVQGGGDARQPELVDLEQSRVPVHAAAATCRREQRGRDASGHVGAGAVVDQPGARSLQHGRCHGGGGRLAIGRGDHDRPAREPAGQLTDRIGLEAEEHATREGGAAPAPGRPRHRAGELRGGQLRAQEGQGTRTAIAPGRIRTVIGRSPTGSPSA